MECVRLEVPSSLDGVRLDQFLSSSFANISRNTLHKLIKQGMVKSNAKRITKPSTKVKQGEVYIIDTLTLPPRSVNVSSEITQKFATWIIHEHPDFFVINKPINLIVHPPSPLSEIIALSDIIATSYPAIQDVGEPLRPGIVHRLDKDTSGLMLIARTAQGYRNLRTLFENRDITKEYIALVRGYPPKSGAISASIARHPVQPQKMTWNTATGREAYTEYHVQEYRQNYSIVSARLCTGRTHQLRVHFASIGHPIIGDSLYGTSCKHLKRQALHAHHLAFTYDNTPYSFTAPTPSDIQRYILTF